MSFSDLPLVTALKTSMRWHQARHKHLAENVAQADVPDARQRDLAPVEYDEKGRLKQVALLRTDPHHLPPLNASGTSGDFRVVTQSSRDTLEDTMLKVAQNQTDYQTALSLYGKSLGVIRTAIGRRA